MSYRFYHPSPVALLTRKVIFWKTFDPANGRGRKQGDEIRRISGKERVKHKGQRSESSGQSNHERPSGSVLPNLGAIFIISKLFNSYLFCCIREVGVMYLFISLPLTINICAQNKVGYYTLAWASELILWGKKYLTDNERKNKSKIRWQTLVYLFPCCRTPFP